MGSKSIYGVKAYNKLIKATRMLIRLMLGRFLLSCIPLFYPYPLSMPSKAVCGKIKYCMDTNTAVEKEHPPRIYMAFVKGFNTLANNAYLLILPILLDILFWVGPKFSIKDTLTVFFNTYLTYFEKGFQQQMTQPGVAEQLEQLKMLQPAFKEIADSFNLFGFLTTTPIGVPSLLGFANITENPFGCL